jgi:arginyl-tRNA synthetase
MDYKEEIAKLLKKESKLDLDFIQLIEVPPNQEMGDYALPCFTLAKEMKKAPQQIAIDLLNMAKPKWLERAEAKGPYLNFFISKSDFIGQIITRINTALQKKANCKKYA